MMNEIDMLKNMIAEAQSKIDRYQQVDREIMENISEYNEIKRDIVRIQDALRECGTSEKINKKIIKMDDDIVEVKEIIKALEEMKKTVEQNIRILGRLIQEKEEQIRRLSMAM